MAEGRPFPEVLTTNRYMRTTGLLALCRVWMIAVIPTTIGHVLRRIGEIFSERRTAVLVGHNAQHRSLAGQPKDGLHEARALGGK